MERGVEAGDRRDVRELVGDGVDRGERPGLVQRRQFGEVLELLADVAVESGGAGEHGPAVDDAVADDIGPAPLPYQGAELIGVDVGRQVRLLDDAVGVIEQAQLQTRRAAVHDQDVHPGQAWTDQVQFVIAGSSSPWARV